MDTDIFRGYEKATAGWIEVICGSMFSGKTEELIRRLNRAIIAGLKVEIFKPAMDVRYDPEQVVSHDKKSIRSTPVSFAEDILLMSADTAVIGIDEGQFFDQQAQAIGRHPAVAFTQEQWRLRIIPIFTVCQVSPAFKERRTFCQLAVKMVWALSP